MVDNTEVRERVVVKGREAGRRWGGDVFFVFCCIFILRERVVVKGRETGRTWGGVGKVVQVHHSGFSGSSPRCGQGCRAARISWSFDEANICTKTAQAFLYSLPCDSCDILTVSFGTNAVLKPIRYSWLIGSEETHCFFKDTWPNTPKVQFCTPDQN